MTHQVSLSIDVIVDAPPEVAWAAITDWERQSAWMMGTEVRVTTSRSSATSDVGTRLEAFTGRRPLGVLDTMVVTQWDPPRRCVVEHTGRVVKGSGVIEVLALPLDRSRVVWRETLILPLGWLGRVGWPIARVPLVWGLQHSLEKFAANVGTDSSSTVTLP